VLFHNHEITYSLACSKGDIGEDPSLFVSYRRICAFLMNFYSSLGLKPYFAMESGDFAKMSMPSRLCSASHEKYDIVVNARKIGGNAQRRTRQAVFQHGSIPLSIDWAMARRYIPSLPEGISSGATCLKEELGYLPERDALEDKLLRAFADTYNVKFDGDSDH
jgi:lipoate-protein ligase A